MQADRSSTKWASSDFNFIVVKVSERNPKRADPRARDRGHNREPAFADDKDLQTVLYLVRTR